MVTNINYQEENKNERTIILPSGIQITMSELQEFINCVREGDYEYACDLHKLWERRADNFSRETERITLERQLENEFKQERESDD